MTITLAFAAAATTGHRTTAAVAAATAISLTGTWVKQAAQALAVNANALRTLVGAARKLMLEQLRQQNQDILVHAQRLNLIEQINVKFIFMQVMENLFQALRGHFAPGRDEAVLYLGPDGPPNRLQLPHFARGHQGDGGAGFPSPPGPANAMHIATRIKRHVEIEDVRDIVDIQAAGRDVRRHQDVNFAASERRHHPAPLGLLHVAMQAIDIVAAAAQENVERVGLFAGPAEDDGLAHVFRVNQADNRIGPFAVLNDVEQLLNVIVGRFVAGRRDLDRIAQNRLRQSHDRPRHGR